MADNSKICALKVNLQCCKACPKKLNKKLLKIKGVSGINMDTEKGLVIVSGSIDPIIFKKTIEQIGIMAEILANDKDPLYAENKPIGQAKNQSPSEDHHSSSPSEASNSDSDDDDPDHSCDEDSGDEEDNHDSDEARYDHEPRGSNGNSWHSSHHDMRRNHGAPIPAFAGSRSMYPNNHPMIYNRPPPHYVGGTRPPLPYPFSIYEQREPAVGNTFHHTFSDENVGACTIM